MFFGNILKPNGRATKQDRTATFHSPMSREHLGHSHSCRVNVSATREQWHAYAFPHLLLHRQQDTPTQYLTHICKMQDMIMQNVDEQRAEMTVVLLLSEDKAWTPQRTLCRCDILWLTFDHCKSYVGIVFEIALFFQKNKRFSESSSALSKRHIINASSFSFPLIFFFIK